MLDFSRYFCIQTFILVKSYNNRTAEYFPCSALASKLVQKAKSNIYRALGSPFKHGASLGQSSALHRAHFIPHSSTGLPYKITIAVETCSILREKSRDVIYANATIENKPHVCFFQDCHVPDIHWRKIIIRSN